MVVGIQEFMERATNEQKEILFKLGELAKIEQSLADKLNAMRSPRNGIVSTDGYSLTVCESDDDLIVIAQKEIRELTVVRKNIASLLKEAVDKYDMGDVGIIQRQYGNYEQWMN